VTPPKNRLMIGSSKIIPNFRASLAALSPSRQIITDNAVPSCHWIQQAQYQRFPYKPEFLLCFLFFSPLQRVGQI
jgi:hypothetical protein